MAMKGFPPVFPRQGRPTRARSANKGRPCWRFGLVWLCLLLPGSHCSAADGSVESLVGRIKAVRKEGAGNPDAAKAWRELVQLGPAALIDILAGIDDIDAVSANWLRSAVDAIAERELNAGRALPAKALEAFVTGRKHSGAARRLAYEWLARVDKTAPSRLLPGMLNDPGQELRRDAIDFALEKARARKAPGQKEAAVVAFKELLAAARDPDQVDAIAKELKERGVAVDLQTQFNFIGRWRLLGPFDNTKMAGFDRAYPPEQRIDVQADHAGKHGKIRWIEHATADPYGMVDLNNALGKNMGAVGYALAEVDSPSERRVELRAGSNNAIKIFLNGKQIVSRDEYHHGVRMDQYASVGTLKKGRNRILVKVCQDEQTASWAQSWGFQLRVCDSLGGAVPIQVVGVRKQREPQR
ncbi:MAG: hypothetical protein HYS12_00865 [Planctomycetes bacterium]|nr:hypothetical protein [Planctomycetota bacterium]